MENQSLTDYPLVSCLMPTENRPHLIKQAIHFFSIQDYPNKEMVILYSTESDLPVDFVYPDNVSLICTGKVKLGSKRNFPMKMVKGTFVAQWDDDDVYGTTRLSAQLAPLIAGEADITGLNNVLFYETAFCRCLIPRPQVFEKMFDGGVLCGTIAFRREIWGTLAEYPDVTQREEGLFLLQALENKARLKKVDGRDLYIYIRHTANTWKFKMTFFTPRSGWIYERTPKWAAPYLRNIDPPKHAALVTMYSRILQVVRSLFHR